MILYQYKKQPLTFSNKKYLSNNLQIDQANLGLGSGTQDYYLNSLKFPEHLEAYKEYQLDTLKLVLSEANINYNVSQLITDINDMTAFETEIAKVLFHLYHQIEL